MEHFHLLAFEQHEYAGTFSFEDATERKLAGYDIACISVIDVILSALIFLVMMQSRAPLGFAGLFYSSPRSCSVHDNFSYVSLSHNHWQDTLELEVRDATR